MKALFEKSGFVTFTASWLFAATDTTAMSWLPLRRAADGLRPDSYGNGLRRRAYHQARIFTATSTVTFVEPIRHVDYPDGKFEYLQSATLNPDAQGNRRLFHAFPAELLWTGLLNKLILSLFAAIPSSALRPTDEIAVGLHLIRIEAEGDLVGISSPNTLHRDGEAVTFIVLVDRENVAGGENWIAPASCANKVPEHLASEQVLARFTLLEPMSGCGVLDEVVSHHVSGVGSLDGRRAHRTVLLVDFVELDPRIRT